ncbi:unnamed protein product [Linum trigynum]|uniref:Uncharacterized protein n=1 Tax=Linum trigynum TaxID=586398 RepID=A0AAV2GK85_9ROSI
MGDEFETPLKGMVENNTLRDISSRIVDKIKLEDVVKSQGQHNTSMQNSLHQILHLLKTREDPTEASKGRLREEKQKATFIPDSLAQTNDEGMEAEDLDLGFLEQHLRSTYGRHKEPNNLQNPLGKELLKTPVPPNFSSLGLPTYSGTSDPTDHLLAFMLRPVPCVLLEGVIENFEQFVMLFSTNFASQRRRKLTVLALIN